MSPVPLTAANRLRRLARWRRVGGAGLLMAPLGAVLASDFVCRGERILQFEGRYTWTYLAAMSESLVLWALLLYASCRRRGRSRWLATGLFVASMTLSFGGQWYFFDQYNAYVNVDVSVFASNLMDSVVSQLFADLGNYLLANLPALGISLALLGLGRVLLRPQRRGGRLAQLLAPPALVAALFIPTQYRHIQAATPDVLYLHAVGGLIRTQLGLTEQSHQLRPRVRQSRPVPALESRRAAAPNLLFIILESVRADATCVQFDPGCTRTPYSNRLLPERLPLRQLRSLSSSTAISLAVLWAGVLPTEDRTVLHEWPLLFDYAKAAGYSTAYWTSQNMMFGNARLWVQNLGVESFVSATDLDPSADLDMGAPEQLLAERVNTEIERLGEPFLAVLQLSNTHYPYYLEADGPLPFQPWDASKAEDGTQAFFNYYQNAVHQADRHVARVIEHVRASSFSERTVIVYTSDHGEAFREHQQMGHTFSVLDEEIKVPGWIDAPGATLTESERGHLAAKADAFTFHVDLSATVLDLMGVWDLPEIAQYRQRMPGRSLIRAGLESRAFFMTNCAGVWSCAFENWGVMRDSLKVEARAWDPAWHCFDVSTDPHESRDRSSPECDALKALAGRQFTRLPGK